MSDLQDMTEATNSMMWPKEKVDYTCPLCGLRWLDGRTKCSHTISPSDRPWVVEPDAPSKGE